VVCQLQRSQRWCVERLLTARVWVTGPNSRSVASARRLSWACIASWYFCMFWDRRLESVLRGPTGVFAVAWAPRADRSFMAAGGGKVVRRRSRATGELVA
jgi:hypothetical protein